MATETDVEVQPLPLPPPDSLRGQYLAAALALAEYETLADGTVYAQVLALPGVWANADTEDSCRRELAEVVQGWIALGLDLGHPIPILAGVDLNPRRVAAA